jgi:hypothetical protein
MDSPVNVNNLPKTLSVQLRLEPTVIISSVPIDVYSVMRHAKVVREAQVNALLVSKILLLMLMLKPAQLIVNQMMEEAAVQTPGFGF